MLGVGAVVLDHLGVRELDAVVGEYVLEQRPEECRARKRPQHVEDARAGLRRLLVAEERERQLAVGEDHGEEHLPADRPDDGVEFARDLLPELLEVFPHLLDRPPDAAPGVRLGDGLLVRLPAGAGEGQVVLLRAEQSVGDPSVDRALRVLPEELRVGGLHGHRGLPVLHAWREGLVHLRDRLLVRMDARAREAALRLVLGLGDRGDVELLPERALALLPASVADERRPCEARAGRLAEVRAGLEALRRVLPQAFPESVEHLADALCEVGADPVRASSALVAVEAVLDELVADSRRAPPELRRDLRDGPSAPGEELNPLPFVCDHLVHCFSPFVWRRRPRHSPQFRRRWR